MALVKFGGGVAGISGKIGGTVYARNKAGAIARNWAKPTNTPSTSQSANRSRFAGGPVGWDTLSRTIQDEWNALAQTTTRLNRLGESYIPTGRQLYLQAFNNLSVVGSPMPNTTPTTDVKPDAVVKPTTVLEADPGNPGIDAFTLTGVVVANTNIVIDTTKSFGNKKTNFANDYRTVFVGPTAASYDITSAWSSVFGTAMEIGDEVAIRIAVISDVTGLRSDSIEYVQTVASV